MARSMMSLQHHRNRRYHRNSFVLALTGLIPAILCHSVQAADPCFRAFWADAFHSGFKSSYQIDSMLSYAAAGGYNAIFAEVMAHQDTGASGHGAYWNSEILPKASDVSSSFDPLAYLVQRAHAYGIEVHCWLVTYRCCSSWPPNGNSIVQPEWIMVPRESIGSGPTTVDGYYVLDPGSPDVQEYLVSIVQELVTNYAIDGIHWDYIRYTTTNAGYPSDLSYAKSGLARFQQITGYSGTPSTSNDQWDDFRRREITELIRRVRAEIPSITTNPQQPLRHSAALITWGNAPYYFSSTNAYSIFQNWGHWMERGYLDAGVPMAYYRDSQYPTYYRNWVDAAVNDWSYDRHMFIGPGIYLNSFSESITQMQYALDAGADGLSTYSYRATNDTGSTWSNWYSYVASNLFTESASTPDMPWRDPSTATEGTLWGQVTDEASGDPIDDATVSIAGQGSVQTDGNGYYTLTLLPATASGTSYQVSAYKEGVIDSLRATQVIAGDVARADFPPDTPPPPCDYDYDGLLTTTDFNWLVYCLQGPTTKYPEGNVCLPGDVDGDLDIDMADFMECQPHYLSAVD